jgi:uncharacterized glyoxalase superfamily protein PhnB
MVNSLTPNLMVRDVDAIADWYCRHLGFQLISSVPHSARPDTLQWAMVQSGQALLMFQEAEVFAAEFPPFRGMQPGGALTLFCQVQGVEDLYRTLSGLCEILDPLKSAFYGMREFTFRDPEGYVVTLAEPEEAAAPENGTLA